jgi:23S rRNA (cytidine1920-2'-O)/16S rRNA (cytidine1409-2'-O)-methyltransferase
MSKQRIDIILYERGLAESRSKAQRLIMAGQVRVEGQLVIKPATKVPTDAKFEISPGPKFVSRGGEKLAAALKEFGLDVRGSVCVDVGASTGGFTDCLLQNGAEHVYSIDVGKGILHWKLRQDERITIMESTNARYVERLPEPIDLVTIDASFISLKILLPVVENWFQNAPSHEIQDGKVNFEHQKVVALIKPQFEAGRIEVSKGRGIIQDINIHKRVLLSVLDTAQKLGFSAIDLMQSPLLGPKGNQEFLTLLAFPGSKKSDPNALIEGLYKDHPYIE